MSDRVEWEDLADAAAVGDALSPDELRQLGAPAGPQADSERGFYDQLGQLGQPEPLHAGDRQRAEATLAAFRRSRPAPVLAPRTGWRWGVGSAVLAVAAALTLWWAWPAPDMVLTPGAVVSSGTLMLDGAPLAAGEPVPVDRWVVAPERSCVRLGDGEGCVSARARLRVQAQRIELAEGALEFSGSGQVVTTLGTVVAADGRFVLHATADSFELRAESGDVRVQDDEGTTEVVPGQPHTRATTPTEVAVAEVPAPVEPTPAQAEAEVVEAAPAVATSSRSGSGKPRPTGPSASELLGTARRQAASGDTPQALSTYGSLRRRYPGSAEAHTANVSVGQLELRRGRAKAALQAFSRYLGRGGPLAEEAHWGKIRALHRLGRTAKRDEAIAALRRAHPASVYLARAAEL